MTTSRPLRRRTGALARLAASVLATALAAAAAAPEAAAQVSCHCFRDRTFDPADPGRTDPYLLATAANSFLAAAYGMPKGEIVRARMSGTAREDLWIAAFAADRLGLEARQLLAARGAAPSWRDVFRTRGVPIEPLGPAFVAGLAAARPDADLARTAAAATAAARLGTPRADLDALAGREATLQETVLAALLGRWTGRRAADLLDDVRGGRATWSYLLAATGRSPSGVEAAVGDLLAGGSSGGPAAGRRPGSPPP